MKKCIVNFVSDKYWFPKGQSRLLESLKKVGFDGDILTWKGDEFLQKELGCPLHSQAPYAFKTYTLMEAKKRGYDLVMWVDASFWAIKPLDKMFEFLEKKGWLMEASNGYVGQWCTDAALNSFGITREEAFKTRLFTAGGIGLNLTNAKSLEFLKQWHEKANDGVSFIGPWDNQDNSMGGWPTVRGHRHDMAIGSIIANKLGMDYLDDTFFSYYREEYKDHLPSGNICFILQGYYDGYK